MILNNCFNKQSLLKTLFALLVFLRYPVLFLAALLGGSGNSFLVLVYVNGTYLVTALFILFERERLDKYHFTYNSLMIFLISPVLLTIISDGFDFTFAFIRVMIAIILSGFLFSHRKEIKTQNNSMKKTVFWVPISIFSGVTMAFIFRMLSNNFTDISFNLAPVGIIIETMCFQLSYAAISEEPLFRGILIKLFRDRKLNDFWVCIIQAGLFMFGHIYYIIKIPISFWITVPIAALLLGWVSIKTKSVAYPMLIHTILNSFDSIFYSS